MNLAGDTYLFTVPEETAGERLDRFLTLAAPFLSRSQAQQLIGKGDVLVNSRRERSAYRVRPNDRIEMCFTPAGENTLAPEPIPLNIVYEDSDLLVIDKPPGLVVHPAAGHRKGTLVNALLYHCPGLTGSGENLRPGIVHRLDKDTSGLLLVGKTEEARLGLIAQLKARQVRRNYLALVYGEVREDRGVIDAPLGRHPVHRKKMAVLSDDNPYGRNARTHYQVRERFPGYTLLDVALETGRTHQIRVHLAYAGYPVAGDPVYGPRRNPLNLPAQALHAYRIAFTHPRTGEHLSFEAPLPPVFAGVLKELRANR